VGEATRTWADDGHLTLHVRSGRNECRANQQHDRGCHVPPPRSAGIDQAFDREHRKNRSHVHLRCHGELTGSTGTATTPLGYDGQYTSSDTGLIYLRNRVYDPKTEQFLTRDPLAAISGEPYGYAGDNPVNYSDPTGLIFGIPGTPSWEEVGEGIAGWGDTITFGGTKWVREQIGDENVDTCSGAYQGGGVAGLVTGVLIPGEDDVVGAEVAEEGASNLGEQLTLEEAEAGAGERIMEGRINDPAYPEDEWAKMSHVHEYPDGSKTEIHFGNTWKAAPVKGSSSSER
jgi:RHS repeat-associated protein